jgi:CBS domain-containing protein
MKRSVRELMKQISINEHPKIHEGATVKQALMALEEYQSDAVLVMRGEDTIGLFSEKDFAKISLTCENGNVLELDVSKAMSTKIVGVSPEYKLDECIALMTSLSVRHLPVFEHGRPIALLNIRHIMQALIQDNEFIISELVKYVTGVSMEKAKNNSEFLEKEASQIL